MIEALSLSRASLGRAITSAIEAMLGGEAVEVRPEPGEFTLASAIGITGTHNAAVVVRANNAATKHFGAAMFGLNEVDVTSAEIADALLELTNVIGGAAKLAVGGENTLMLPVLVPVDLTEDDVRKADNVISFAVRDRIVGVHVVDGVFIASD